jgi:hypothetical protein
MTSEVDSWLREHQMNGSITGRSLAYSLVLPLAAARDEGGGSKEHDDDHDE